MKLLQLNSFNRFVYKISKQSRLIFLPVHFIVSFKLHGQDLLSVVEFGMFQPTLVLTHYVLEHCAWDLAECGFEVVK